MTPAEQARELVTVWLRLVADDAESNGVELLAATPPVDSAEAPAIISELVTLAVNLLRAVANSSDTDPLVLWSAICRDLAEVEGGGPDA
jgi:hypothetical protein